MAQYTIKAGDTLDSIAGDYGMSWRQLYYHRENAGFRAKRTDPNKIYPGDVLWVPEEKKDNKNSEGVEVEFFGLSMDVEEQTTKYLDPAMFHDGDELYHYKVRSGDTLESIAEAHGLDWEEIAILNWGTTDREEIEYYLENYFVCGNKQDGKCVFADEDDPGILLLPCDVEPGSMVAKQTIRASRFRVEE